MVKRSPVNVTGLLTTLAFDDCAVLPPHIPLFKDQRARLCQVGLLAPKLPQAPSKYLARTRHCDTQLVQTTC